MNTKITNTVTHKHVKGCTAVKAVESGRWKTPWYFTGETTWRRGKRYLVAKCNSAQCQAHLIVHEGHLFEAIASQLKMQ